MSSASPISRIVGGYPASSIWRAMKRSTSSWRSVSSVMAGRLPEHRYTGTMFRRQEDDPAADGVHARARTRERCRPRAAAPSEDVAQRARGAEAGEVEPLLAVPRLDEGVLRLDPEAHAMGERPLDARAHVEAEGGVVDGGLRLRAGHVADPAVRELGVVGADPGERVREERARDRRERPQPEGERRDGELVALRPRLADEGDRIEARPAERRARH